MSSHGGSPTHSWKPEPTGRACSPSLPSRRAFIAGASLAGAAAVLSGSAFAAPPPEAPVLLCSTGTDTLVTLQVARPAMTLLSTPAPRHHAQHPALPIVYVANATEQYHGVPRATVSAMRFDPRSGALVALGTVPFAQGACDPEALVVSPTGSHLLLLSSRHGAISVVPLSDAGIPDAVTHEIRVIGRSRASLRAYSRPRALACHHTLSRVYVSDSGLNALLTLRLDGNALELLDRRDLPEGFEPRALALGLDDDTLLLGASSTPHLLELTLDPVTGIPSTRERIYPLPGQSVEAIAFTPVHHELIVASRQASSILLTTHAGTRPHLRLQTISVPYEHTAAHLLVPSSEQLAVFGTGGLALVNRESGALLQLHRSPIFGASVWPRA